MWTNIVFEYRKQKIPLRRFPLTVLMILLIVDINNYFLKIPILYIDYSLSYKLKKPNMCILSIICQEVYKR